MDVQVYKRWDLRHRRIVGYTAEFAGVRAKGDNPKQAKDNLAEVLPKAIKWLQQDPTIFKCGSYFCTVAAGYSDGPVCSSYIICPDNHICQMSQPADWNKPVNDDMAKCERSARMHIAQMRYSDGDTLAIESLNYLPDIREFNSWVQFQERYRVLVDLGYNSNDAHYIACGSPAHPKYEDAISNPPSQPNLAGIAS